MSDQTKNAAKMVRRMRFVTYLVYGLEPFHAETRRVFSALSASPREKPFYFFLDDDFFDEDFFEDDFFEDDFFEDDFFDGTFPPARLASDNPMAMACFLLVTFL